MHWTGMIEKLKEDKLYIGLILGILLMITGYFFLYFVNDWCTALFEKNYLPAPKLQLLLLAINILVFRFVMLSIKKYETGKGMLIVIAFTTLFYIITHHNII